jgi:RNA polymerase sigma-70 factor (ECF subfamily)
VGREQQPSRRTRFESLFGEHYDDVLAYALRRSDGETAQDVVAETFLVAWRRLDAVPADPLPWLYGVARRVLANQRRAGRRRDALARRLAVHAEASDRRAMVGDSSLLRALARLSESDREALVLVAWEGLDQGRVAAALGCRPATLRVRLYRARRRLAHELQREENPLPTALSHPANLEKR